MADLNELIAAYRRATPQQRVQMEALYGEQLRQQPDESLWEYGLRRATRPGNLETASLLNRALDFTLFSPTLQQNLQGLNPNRTPNQGREERARRTPEAQINLLRPEGQAPQAGIVLAPPSGASPSAVAPARMSSAGDFLRAAGFGDHITGEDRNETRNAEVNGARNSWHLQRGKAVDVRPIPGMTFNQLVDQYRRAGWTIHEALDETKSTRGTGPHWHIAASPPGGGGGASPASMPNLSAPSPQDLMRFIPTPRQLPQINLPDAPQQALPAARPNLELADRDALLAPLREAMAVQPRDQSQDPWDRVQAMLQGAAMGAAQADPTQGLGQLILLAGGGGLGGFREERGEQRALNREEQEAQRQVASALAKMGLDLDLTNLDTRNQNRQIDWQSGEDRRTVDFSNASSSFETLVQEMMANQGITAQNIGALNQADMTRGQVGAGALQDQFNVNNQAQSAGWQLEQQRALAAAGGRGAVPPGTSLLLGVGLNPERQPQEPPEVTLARSYAGQIEMGDANAGLNGLASEMVARGLYADESIFSADIIRSVEEAIQQEKPQAAVNILLGALQSNPGGQQALVDAMAAKNSLIAKMIKARQGTR